MAGSDDDDVHVELRPSTMHALRPASTMMMIDDSMGGRVSLPVGFI